MLKMFPTNPWLTALPALGLESADLALDIRRHFNYTLGRGNRRFQSQHYKYLALALAIRDRVMQYWINTNYAYWDTDCRHAYYLSMEFLLGRSLPNAILSLGLHDEVAAALDELGLELEDLADCEPDAGLGNGGLGRLAACFMDSCATLSLPVTGYGLRYEYGMFRQEIDNGHQQEALDHWLRDGCVWELERPELAVRVQFGGHTERYRDNQGRLQVSWIETRDVLAIAYDLPLPGYRNGTVNTLRLWKSAATDELDLGEFHSGDYGEAVASKNASELISMVLYPNDVSENGKVLRLRQQYFLVSASLQDVLRRWVFQHGNDFSQFADKNCFQLNDTHPSLAVAELMRLLMDQQGLTWDEAWAVTARTMAYTNHTLMPEALERWPVRLFRQLLPRLLEIIYEINARFLEEVASTWPGDGQRRARMSLIEEGDDPQIRMAFLAIVGSYSVNGVAELHSRLLAQGLFRDFHDLWPAKFNNKTNGVTPRRWLVGSNPTLARLISGAIGEGWITDLSQLQRLAPFAEDSAFRQRWAEVKHANKLNLLRHLDNQFGFEPEGGSGMLFDVQVKRIHEYKRQLLNVLHVIHLYDRIKRAEIGSWTPRCVIFGGKAAPGYAAAKRIIKLINNVAAVINGDPEAHGLLNVIFVPDYRVTEMERLCPAVDLSEQISTAGTEASGTGNMKLMINGGLTIGTPDGANLEILEAVGPDNFFLFGLTAKEVQAHRVHYDPDALIEQNEDLQRVLRLLDSGRFNLYEPGIFDGLLQGIRSPSDPWMIAADFPSYVAAQRRAADAYLRKDAWARMSILNTAASGRFSSDRTIAEYNRDIWHLEPVPALSMRADWDPTI